jgi:hypothetical protein
MRPIPAPRIGDSHGLLRAIDERDRLRLDEFVTEFAVEDLYPPDLENALGRTRQFISFARAAGLCKEDRGVVELTDVGRRYIRAGDAALPFDVAPGQAEWLRRQLREKHMTDSIYHGLAISLSLLASSPGARVAVLDFGRALSYLGRAGWDNENTLEIQGERHLVLLRDLELLDEQRTLTAAGAETKGELTLPIHMSLLDLAAQLNPGGADAVRQAGEAEWASASEPPPAPEPVAAAAEPAAEDVVVDEDEYQDVGPGAWVEGGSGPQTAPQPVVPPEPVAPPEPVVAPEPVAEPEPVGSAVPTEPAPPSEPVRSEPAAPTEPAPASEPVRSEPAAPTESAPPAEPVRSEPVAAPEPVAPAEPEPVAAPEPVAPAEPEPVAAPEPVAPAPEPVGAAAPTPPPDLWERADPDDATRAIPAVRAPAPADPRSGAPTVVAKPAFVAGSAIRAAAEARGLRLGDAVYANLAAALATGRHVVLTGPPASGKTELALAVAQAAVDGGKASGVTTLTASDYQETRAAATRGRWVVVDDIADQPAPPAFLARVPITVDGNELTAPDSWRMVATAATPPKLSGFAVIHVTAHPDLATAIDEAAGDATAAAATKRLLPLSDLTALGAGTFLAAARHAAARRAEHPADEATLAREIYAAYFAPHLAGHEDRAREIVG